MRSYNLGILCVSFMLSINIAQAKTPNVHNSNPVALKGKGDLLPVPGGYAVRWQGVILAQSTNIVRELTITQYDSIGSAINSATIHYDKPDQTGINCGNNTGCYFPSVNKRTWFTTAYSLSRTSLVTKPGRVTTRTEVFGQREAFIEIAYAKKRSELPAINLP